MTRSTAALGLVAIACSLSLTSCGLTRHRMLVWHDWPEPESDVLDELLASYSELEPDLHVIVEYVPSDELEARFAKDVQSGFGPDVVIGVDADRLPDLVAASAVHSIDDDSFVGHEFDALEERATAVMAVDGTQQGIPLSGFTDVLYYREGIDPPETLADIIRLAEEGHTTGIPVDFMRSYWGVDAFGGTVFGDDAELDPDTGFTRWMQWLVDARPQPNIVLDTDYESLREYFSRGQIDLFVGGSSELAHFRTELQRMGSPAADDGDGTPSEETQALANIHDVTFGVTTLPSGANSSTGGFLEIEGMVINRHTSRLDESLELVEYLTNVPSQGRIARSGLGRIPINEQVSVDPMISPMEAALVRQQQRSVVLPPQFQEGAAVLREVGNEIYLQVARGLLDPHGAASELEARYELANAGVRP